MAKGKTPKAASLAPPRDDAARIASLEQEVADLTRQLHETRDRSANLHLALTQRERTVAELMSSSSWRLTAPVRAAKTHHQDPRNAVALPQGSAARPHQQLQSARLQSAVRPDGQRELLTPEKLEALRKLFDEEYYVEHNPEVELAGFEPFRHFMEVGRFKGLKATRETEADIEASRSAVQRRILRRHQP